MLQMYGIEVQKNPAAMMYCMMIVDLLDGDKIGQLNLFYTLDMYEYPKEKGCGGDFPSSFHGHTTAARWLNYYYSFVFEHWYSYDITDENEESIFENIMNPKSEYNVNREHKVLIEEMLKREYELIIRWLDHKKERDRKARYLTTIQDLYNYILVKTAEYHNDYKISFK